MFYSADEGHHGTMEPTSPAMISHHSTTYHLLAQLARSLSPFLEPDLLGGEANHQSWYFGIWSSWTSGMGGS